MTVRLIYSYERPSCVPFIIILGLVTPQSRVAGGGAGRYPSLTCAFLLILAGDINFLGTFTILQIAVSIGKYATKTVEHIIGENSFMLAQAAET